MAKLHNSRQKLKHDRPEDNSQTLSVISIPLMSADMLKFERLSKSPPQPTVKSHSEARMCFVLLDSSKLLVLKL